MLGYYVNAQIDRVSVLYYRDELSVPQAVLFCVKIFLCNILLFILLSVLLYFLDLLDYTHLCILHNLSVLAVLSVVVQNPPATYSVENVEEFYG